MKPEIKERVEKIRNGEVPEGYKETKVGIIPVDWKITTFQDIADKKVKWSITGGPFGSNLKASEYVSNGVRIIQLQNIGDGVFNDNYKIYTSEEKANELLSCNIFPNEIILSKMGDPVARACFVPNKGTRFLMSSDGIRLVVSESRFSKKFIHDYINSIYFRKRAFDASIGSTRLRIGLQDLKKLLVIAPPLPEQQKIAEILSTWDQAIELKEKLIDERNEFKRGLMNNIITIKMNDDSSWKFTKFKDIFKTIKRPIDKHPEKKYKRLTVKRRLGGVQLRDIKKGKEILVDSQHIVKEGDFIISKRQVFHGAIGVVQKKLENSIISTEYSILRCNEGFDTEFLFYCMHSPQFKKTIIKRTQGIHEEKFLFLFNEWYKTLGLHIPSIDEQKSTVSVLNSLNENIQILTNEVAQLKEQKRGLMQLLLTGIVRVEVD